MSKEDLEKMEAQLNYIEPQPNELYTFYSAGEAKNILEKSEKLLKTLQEHFDNFYANKKDISL